MEDANKDLATVAVELAVIKPEEWLYLPSEAARISLTTFTPEVLAGFGGGAAAAWLSARILVMTALAAGAYLAGVEQDTSTPFAMAPTLFAVGVVLGLLQAFLTLMGGPPAGSQALLLLGICTFLTFFLSPLRFPNSRFWCRPRL